MLGPRKLQVRRVHRYNAFTSKPHSAGLRLGGGLHHLLLGRSNKSDRIGGGGGFRNKGGDIK